MDDNFTNYCGLASWNSNCTKELSYEFEVGSFAITILLCILVIARLLEPCLKRACPRRVCLCRAPCPKLELKRLTRPFMLRFVKLDSNNEQHSV